jgi:hypothetical protein
MRSHSDAPNDGTRAGISLPIGDSTLGAYVPDAPAVRKFVKGIVQHLVRARLRIVQLIEHYRSTAEDISLPHKPRRCDPDNCDRGRE